MGEDAATHTPSTHASGASATVWCAACGYVLDGLPRTSVCPECGSAARLPADEPSLRHAPHAYLRRLTLGLQVMTSAVLVVGVAAGLTIATLVFSQRLPHLALLFCRTAIACGLGLLGVGLWLFASPERTPGAAPEVTWPRLLTRVLGAVAGVSALVVLVMLALPGEETDIGALAAALAIGGSLSGAYVAMIHGVRIAGRIPDDALRRDFEAMRWVVFLIATIGFIALFTGPVIAAGVWWWLVNRLRVGVERELRAARTLDGASPGRLSTPIASSPNTP